MYAQIGNIALENQKGFESFLHEKGASLPEHAVIDGKPRLQKTGNKLDKVTFTINLHLGFCIPEDVINEFENYVVNSTPVPVTLGTGKFLGNFILTDIKKNIVQTNSIGRIIECKIEILAIEWVSGKTNFKKLNPTSVTTSNPPTIASVPVPVPVSGQIVAGVRESQNLAVEVDKNLSVAESNPSKRNQKFKETLLKIQHIDDKLVNVYTATANIFVLINESNNLRARIKATRNALANLKSFCQIQDVDGAKQANRDFQAVMKQTSNLTAPFTKQYVVRRSL
jgi:hypothetical protein